jgi:hypothetical protein
LTAPHLSPQAKFDQIMDQCSTYLFSDKKEIGREVVNKVPLFQSLSASERSLLGKGTIHQTTMKENNVI